VFVRFLCKEAYIVAGGGENKTGFTKAINVLKLLASNFK
jgi:hypothetical protein